MVLKIKNLLIATLIILGSTFSLNAALAATTATDGTGTTGTTSTTTTTDTANTDPCHPELHVPPGQPLSTTDLQACKNCKDSSVAGIQRCLDKNPITKDLNKFVDFLAAAVGVVTVAIIILGGIQYSMARNKPEAVSAARTRVMNGVIALVAFMLIWAFVQWLIPGGAFG